MEGLDVIDVLAVIFGVLFTIRKLDAVSRQNSEFPHVAPAAWTTWQERERRVYGLGSWACFLKVALDLGFTHFLMAKVPYGFARYIGGAIDLTWLAIVILTFVRAMGLGKHRRELGIILGGYVTDEAKDEKNE